MIVHIIIQIIIIWYVHPICNSNDEMNDNYNIHDNDNNMLIIWSILYFISNVWSVGVNIHIILYQISSMDHIIIDYCYHLWITSSFITIIIPGSY